MRELSRAFAVCVQQQRAVPALIGEELRELSGHRRRPDPLVRADEGDEPAAVG